MADAHQPSILDNVGYRTTNRRLSENSDIDFYKQLNDAFRSCAFERHAALASMVTRWIDEGFIPMPRRTRACSQDTTVEILFSDFTLHYMEINNRGTWSAHDRWQRHHKLDCVLPDDFREISKMHELLTIGVRADKTEERIVCTKDQAAGKLREAWLQNPGKHIFLYYTNHSPQFVCKREDRLDESIKRILARFSRLAPPYGESEWLYLHKTKTDLLKAIGAMEYDDPKLAELLAIVNRD
jgi:hypothetical protein